MYDRLLEEDGLLAAQPQDIAGQNDGSDWGLDQMLDDAGAAGAYTREDAYREAEAYVAALSARDKVLLTSFVTLGVPEEHIWLVLGCAKEQGGTVPLGIFEERGYGSPSEAQSAVEACYNLSQMHLSVMEAEAMLQEQRLQEAIALATFNLANAVYDSYYNPKPVPEPAFKGFNFEQYAGKPPGWNVNWEWRYPEANKPYAAPRWFDPNGGEWRWHAPDNHHSEGHWDYNPWSAWNSNWQNIYPD